MIFELYAGLQLGAKHKKYDTKNNTKWKLPDKSFF